MFKYNYLSLPMSVQYRRGDRIEYVYDAAGVKRKTTHKVTYQDKNYGYWSLDEPAPADFNPNLTVTTDYIGNKVYMNNQLKYVLTEEGYIEKATGSNTFTAHYYLNDRLGNRRIVIDATNAVKQVNNYYPSGTSMAEYPRRTDQGIQPYKFGGKELDRFNTLDFYDFEARAYDPVLMRFTRLDPLTEKYPGISPYAYCANNPVNRVDPDGMDSYYTNDGQFIYTDNKETDEIRIVNNYVQQLIGMAKATSSGKLSAIDIQNAIQSGDLKSEGVGDSDLSAKAYSNIFTDVLSKMEDVNMKELYNGVVSTAVFDGNLKGNPLKGGYKNGYYNTNVREYTETASHQGINYKSLVTASILVGGKNDNQYLYSTVSNVQNLLGAHELLGHGIEGNKNRWRGTVGHSKVFDFQKAHLSWSKTTPEFKRYINKISNQ